MAHWFSTKINFSDVLFLFINPQWFVTFTSYWILAYHSMIWAHIRHFLMIKSITSQLLSSLLNLDIGFLTIITSISMNFSIFLLALTSHFLSSRSPPSSIEAIDTIIDCGFRFIRFALASSAYHLSFLAFRFHKGVIATRISFSLL